MHKKSPVCRRFLTLWIAVFFLFTGCSGGSSSENHSDSEQRTTVSDYLLPSAPGTTVYENQVVSIDASNISDGYFTVRYHGNSGKVKLQVTAPDGTVYTYTLKNNPADPGEVFPLSCGNGAYRLDVLEHAHDDLYAVAFSQELQVTISDELKPFLYPNQYVWFTPENEAVKYAADLSDQSSNDLDYVEQIYHYVTENIEYDDELAETVESGYLPDIDTTMDTKKGICFDYASLMAAMLRSQGIPTKLVVGYSGDAYHAWISVHLEEIGWVDDIIEFDGTDWVLMDPTLAANNSSKAVEEYVGDGSNYTVKYSY